MDELEDSEFGRLMRALLKYSMTGEPMALTGNERFYAKRVMARENRYQESYKKQSAINTKNGANGGRPGKNDEKATDENKTGAKPKETEVKRNEPNESEINRNKAKKTETNRSEPNKSEKTHTNTDTDTDTNTNTSYEGLEANASCAEPQAASTPETAPTFQIPLNNGSFWPIHADMISHWRDLYPAVDVEQEIRKMIGWCEANPTKRKTARGVTKFINGWLTREQDRGGNRAPVQSDFINQPSEKTGVKGRFAERLEQRKREGKI